MAGPPSPEKPGSPKISGPRPATVVILPVSASTFRIRKLLKSEMYRLPAASRARPSGFRPASVAAPPSPEKKRLPLPAMVVMMPVLRSIRRTRLLPSPAASIPMGPAHNVQGHHSPFRARRTMSRSRAKGSPASIAQLCAEAASHRDRCRKLGGDLFMGWYKHRQICDTYLAPPMPHGRHSRTK